MYKPSRYNNFQQLNGSVLAYNSVSDSFLLLESILSDLFWAAVNENNVQGIEEIHPAFFNELKEKGFIVDAEKKELEEVRDWIKTVDGDDTFYNIIINPTMNCNFSCWYCYEDHVKGSKMSPETIDAVRKLVDNIANDKKIEQFSLSWFGGEPLLYYKQVMVPILEYTKQKCEENDIAFSSDITTNGMLITDSAVESFKELGLHYFQITLDGNRELHDKVRFVNKKKGSYDEIMKNISKLCENGITTNVRINFTEETLNGICDIIDDLVVISDEGKELLSIDFHQVWQTKSESGGDHHDLLNNTKLKFREAGLNVVKNNGHGIIDSCYADKTNEVVINYNRDLFKCTARDFTKENSLGVLNLDGTLSWGDKIEVRQNAKLNNPPCQECSILPQCGSGCSQFAYESEGDQFCVYNFDESKKQEMIKNHFYDTVGIES